jgi:hypothetical protein
VHINFCANSHDHIQTTDLRPDTAHAFIIDRTLRTPVRVVRQAASTLRTGIPTADFSGNPVSGLSAPSETIRLPPRVFSGNYPAVIYA